MDHLKILKRAYAITLDYRVLWIFGIILALTTGSASGRASGGGGDGGHPPSGPGGPDWPPVQISQDVFTALIVIGVSLICFFILLAVIGTIARYVAETSLITMVDRYEASGEKLTLREGFRLGWSRKALHLFLIDLVVGLPVFLGVLLLLIVAAAPLLVWLTTSDALRVIGTLTAIGLGMLVILLATVVGVVLGVLLHFFRRVCVLEEQGVMESLRRGWALVRQRPGDVALMALILFVLGLGYALLMIPIVLLLVMVAAVLVGLTALLIGSVVTLLSNQMIGIIVGVVLGLPAFIFILSVPLAFIGGLVQVFVSSTWTLSYRELLALESIQPAAQLPEPEQPE